ncbi:MAG: M24 family metallopeptidase [Muribaculaceae bacterium]|nr:M24 family metallopeptidase [Muribaculaceae bacterium]
MDSITVIKNFMAEQHLNYLLVNSTNEFLVEYNTLEENSRYKLTNFSGSTGEALVTPNTIYLFVDGRYHIQADNEVCHEKVTVVKLQTGQKYIEELVKRVPKDEVLGVFSKKNSQKKVEYLKKYLLLKLLDNDPLDNDVTVNLGQNAEIDVKYIGLSSDEKISKICQNLGYGQSLYVTDLDEVSYLFNLRNFSQNFSAKIRGKCLISYDGNAKLFTQDNLNEIEGVLRNFEGEVLVDKNTINAYDFGLIPRTKALEESPVKLMKAQKTPEELAHLKDAFARTDKAVEAIRDYINNNDNLSEFDISEQLEKEFKKQGAVGLSFKSIVAKDENSALAHYSKSSKDEFLTDGSLILIDCGGYFEGGLATDITRVFVKGEPSKLHKKIYTLVLKAFLRAFNYENPKTGFEIDDSVRKFFGQQELDGFVFNHGLGHGIGINVHENPPNLSPSEIARVELKDGMCFSIEPGLYKEGLFGVRLENSCYFEGGKIHSFVKMNYEKKLIDFDMLTSQEKEWLKSFEVK